MSPPPTSSSTTLTSPSITPDEQRWFRDEVQTHDGQLRAYLRGSFPAVRDVDDVVQESYLRIWKARAGREIKSVRAFLFTVARHLAIDLVRREKISPVAAVEDVSTLDVHADSAAPGLTLDNHAKVRLLSQAVAALPARCRDVIVLHKIQGLSQRETAIRLGLADKTVENQVAFGVRRCEEFFRKHGVEHF